MFSKKKYPNRLVRCTGLEPVILVYRFFYCNLLIISYPFSSFFASLSEYRPGTNL